MKTTTATGEWIDASIETMRQVAKTLHLTVAELRNRAYAMGPMGRQWTTRMADELEREARAIEARLPPF